MKPLSTSISPLVPNHDSTGKKATGRRGRGERQRHLPRISRKGSSPSGVVQRMVLRLIDDDNWLYKANKDFLEGRVGAPEETTDPRPDFSTANVIGVIGHGAAGRIYNEPAGKYRDAGQLAAILTDTPSPPAPAASPAGPKAIKNKARISLWSCHAGAGVGGGATLVSQLANEIRARKSTWTGDVGGAAGLHIPDPFEKRRYSGPQAGSTAEDALIALERHFEAECGLAPPGTEYDFTFNTPSIPGLDGKTRRLKNQEQDLHASTADVEAELESRNLLQAGASQPKKDKAVKKATKNFYKAFIGDKYVKLLLKDIKVDKSRFIHT